MPRRRYLKSVPVDERTKDMTEAALLCRSLGHQWVMRAASRQHTLSLLRQGLREFDRECRRPHPLLPNEVLRCGGTWRQVWSIHERMIVENERHYPPAGAYLLPPGTGRLARADAIVAQVAREFPEYV